MFFTLKVMSINSLLRELGSGRSVQFSLISEPGRGGHPITTVPGQQGSGPQSEGQVAAVPQVDEERGVRAGQGLQHLHRLQLPARAERGHVGLHAEVLHEELWLGTQRCEEEK